MSDVINIVKLAEELFRLYELKEGEKLSKLELALGKDGAKKAIQGISKALEKHLHPSILPWRHDIADAQRLAKQVIIDMKDAAINEANKVL